MEMGAYPCTASAQRINAILSGLVKTPQLFFSLTARPDPDFLHSLL
jgi:hypothetical protein